MSKYEVPFLTSAIQAFAGRFEYKLLARERKSGGKTHLYSLPGNGETQDVSTPSSKHSARKIARDGQVLVETGTNTFDLRGQEVR